MAKKLYKSFMTVTFFNIITRLTSFAFHIYLSRALGAENIGIFQITCSILFMFVSFSSSGFPVTLSRKIAYYDAIGEYTRSESMLSSTLIMTGTLSASICIFFTLFPSSLNLLFSNPACTTPFMLLLPALFAGSIYSTLRAWFWGKKRYVLYSTIEFIDEILMIAVMSTLLATGVFEGAGYNALALGHSIADIICVIIIIIIFCIFGGKLSRPRHFKELTISSAPLTTTRIVSSMVSSTVALLLPSLLVRSGLDMSFATAEYGRMSGMAIPIILSPGAIVSSLIIVMIPDLSGTVSKHGISAITRTVKNAMLFSTAISGLFMAVFLTCGGDIGMLFYDDSRVGEMISKCALIAIPLVLNQLSASIINTLGKESWTFITSMVSSAGLVMTILLSAKTAHVYAYPIGLAVFHSIGFVMNTYQLIKQTKLHKSYLFAIASISALSFAVALLAGLLHSSLSNAHLLTRLTLTILAIVTSFLAILLLLRRKISLAQKGTTH